MLTLTKMGSRTTQFLKKNCHRINKNLFSEQIM